MNADSKNDALELIRKYLPKYLTPELQEDLFKIVNEHFPKGDNESIIYSNITDESYFYQGDGIIDIPFASFHKGDYHTKYFNGVVMSNTCDIAMENERLENAFVQCSCIFKLNDYLKELRSRKISKDRIDAFILNLKTNRISNLFYLPKKTNGREIVFHESFVRFDLNTTFPILDLMKNYSRKYLFEKGDRIFSLSNYGFYLFLVKLSIHYCRVREGVFRSA